MLENNVICLLLDGKLKTTSRWQKFVIESLSHSNDSFKTTESFRSESNDCFYEWFSESVIRPRQRGFGFEHRNETKTASTLARVIRPNCQEHFLLAYLEISKLAACILKHNIINEYIYIYIYNDKNQVQSAMLMNGIVFVIAKMLPETNYYTSRSGQMNKTAIILSCKILWCWISDAWSAVF